MWPRPRRASASARRMTRRLLAERRTPRRAAQVGHQPSAGCCAAAVPHQQLVPPPRRPAAPRWLRERATSGVDWGWGGGGILASCPRWPPHRDGRADRAPRGASEFWFPGAKKGQPASFIIRDRDLVKLWAEFSPQIPNGRFLIPARRSQNMRGRIQRCLRLPISRDKTAG